MEGIEINDLLQTVFESAPNGIAVMQTIYDEDGSVKDFSILLFNAHTLNWIGDIDYKGKLYGDVFPMVKQTGILDKFKEVAATGIPVNFERKYTGEGMNHWFRFTAVRRGGLLVVTTEDISDRKQAEIALDVARDTMEQQQRIYDSITNTTPDLVYVFDLDYRFTYANKALLAMWGKTAEDAIGKGLRDNGYEEWHAQMHEREIDDIVANKKNIRGTVSFPHAELGSRIYDYILAPVFNEHGQVEAIAGITRDITGFKHAEERLQQSETRLKSIIDQTPAATLVLRGADLSVEQINEAMLELIGRGKEIIGMPLIAVLPELEGQYVWTQVQKVYNEGIPFDQSEVHVPHNRTGEMKDYYYNLAYRPLVENEKITGMIQVAIDVSEQVIARKKLEESESSFRMLSDEMPQFVWTGDTNGQLFYFNEAVYQYSGLSPEDTINGGWIQIVHPDDREENVRLWQLSIANGEDFIFEHRFKRADGEYRWQLSRAVPQRDAQGVIQQWIGTSTDIHDQKNVEEQLERLVRERTKELQRSNEDLQQFAHVASHDLKEPVRKIKTFTDRLEKNLSGKLDADGSKFIDRINVATDRMFTMIDGVLAYSTINADAQKAELTDLNEVIKNIETDLEVTLQATGAKIQSGVLPTLEGAPVLLYQLFYNLINNSIKFVIQGTAPSITISAEQTLLHGENFARITLQDNGIGFEAQFAERIFDTFTRLNSKDKYEGTGLGLALCKKIVERHGGSITAVSESGAGATFTIVLPMQQKQAIV